LGHGAACPALSAGRERRHIKGANSTLHTHHENAAAHNVWLKKCAPCMMRRPPKSRPAAKATASPVQRKRGKSNAQPAKYTLNKDKAVAVWTLGSAPPPACPGAAQNAVGSSSEPPNMAKVHGRTDAVHCLIAPTINGIATRTAHSAHKT